MYNETEKKKSCVLDNFREFVYLIEMVHGLNTRLVQKFESFINVGSMQYYS